MKNLNGRSLICGMLIGAIAGTTLFAVVKAKTTDHNMEETALKQSVYSETKQENSTYKDDAAKVQAENIDSNKVQAKTVDCAYGSETEKASLQNETDQKALDIMQRTGNWNYVKPLFPAMTPAGVQAVVNLYIQKTGNYKKAEEALPYINRTDSSEAASTAPKTQSDYDALANEAVTKTGKISSMMVYVPHMSTEKVDALVKEYIERTKDFNSSYAIRQYMSTKGIDDIVQSYIEKTGDYGTVAAMLQFMSKDASKSIAEKYIGESKDQQYRKFFDPYL